MQNAKCKMQNEHSRGQRPGRSSICNLQWLAVMAGLCLTLAGLAGCTQQPATTATSGGNREERLYRDELFNSAVENLGRLDEFESGAAFQDILARLQKSTDGQALGETIKDPLLATWPQPPMLRQIVDRLNLWLRSDPPEPTWRRDPFVDTLKPEYKQIPSLVDLEKMEFSYLDGFGLAEAVWMRDVSSWTRGEALDDVSRAVHLFDWTVRNIADEPPAVDTAGKPVEPLPQVAWEALLYGRGTAWERAWVFILLARQQGLDAAVLAIPGEQGESRPWAIGLLSQGKIYVFDPALGLPLPAQDGVKRGRRGLEIQPATLAELAANDALLRRLDADEKYTYPVKADDLKNVAVLLEASPAYLARRSALLESRLTGQNKVVLTTAPSAVAERWKKAPQVSDVQLWRHPYETILQRLQLPTKAVQMYLLSLVPFYGEQSSIALRRGRLLHLKGKLSGDRSAAWWYQQARPANEDLAKEVEKHLQALKDEVKKLPAEQRAAALQQGDAMIRLNFGVSYRIKQDASYWLGTLSFDRGNYPSALDYFVNRVLRAALPGEQWLHAAHYNRARTLEAEGSVANAIELYRADTATPLRAGNLLRAKWLEELLRPAAESRKEAREE